jgi:uncharacterized protein
LPTLTRPVSDFAGVMDAASARELERRIRSLEAATGDTVAVATVKTFRPYATIEEYAVELFENAGRGIGQKGKDNGALIVAAIDDRAVRIEVGYDLEEFITDGFAGETIRTAIVPEFRGGAYGRGLLAGGTRVINRIAERRGVTLQDVPRERRPVAPPAEFPRWLIIVAVWLVIMMLSSRGGGRRRRRRFWGGGPWSGWNSGVGPFGGGTFGGGFGGFGGRGGGFGGGGFGGFGGGRSGGGGASGSW